MLLLCVDWQAIVAQRGKCCCYAWNEKLRPGRIGQLGQTGKNQTQCNGTLESHVRFSPYFFGAQTTLFRRVQSVRIRHIQWIKFLLGQVRANVQAKILDGASFRGTQVEGRTAATGLGTALVLALYVNASHTCILIQIYAKSGRKGRQCVLRAT